MRHKGILLGLLFFSSSIMADTLYQANVGNYSTGIGIGVGVGVGAGVGVNTYPSYSGSINMYGGYDNFTYPRSSGCCGCNTCNNCGTSYFRCN